MFFWQMRTLSSRKCSQLFIVLESTGIYVLDYFFLLQTAKASMLSISKITCLIEILGIIFKVAKASHVQYASSICFLESTNISLGRS